LSPVVHLGLVLHTAQLFFGQEVTNDSFPQPENKRQLGVVPNHRTSPSLNDYEPLTTGKFKVASEDAVDRGTAILAAFFAERPN
jgi:hypothetical protein